MILYFGKDERRVSLTDDSRNTFSMHIFWDRVTRPFVFVADEVAKKIAKDKLRCPARSDRDEGPSIEPSYFADDQLRSLFSLSLSLSLFPSTSISTINIYGRFYLAATGLRGF